MLSVLPSQVERRRAGAPGDSGSCWVALLMPFAYFFLTRVPTSRRKAGWVFSYLLPVLGLAAAAHGSWQGALLALPVLVAVYAAYEFGYLVNDTVAVEREAVPTLRMDEASRRWLRARLGHALMARVAVCVAALSLWASIGTPQWTVLLGWIALWPGFALYNHWRGRVTIALHLVLVGLRFILPIAAAGTPAAAVLPWAPLLLLYPMPNTYEAAWKPRYGLGILGRLFGGNVHRFRVTWHASLLVAALAWLAVSTAPESRVFAAACGYYLVLRTLSWCNEVRGTSRVTA